MNIVRQTRILLFFFLLGSRCLLFAGTSGILDGRIVDKTTREPLVAVNIQIMGTTLGGVTDPEGYYQINNIHAAIYDVRFSLIGYKSVVMKKVAILADLRTRLDVTMEASSVELQDVIITAKKPLIQRDQPSTAFSFGDVKLDRLPITTFQDVIALQPGVTMEGNVRGGKANEVLYLIDGVPVQDYIEGGLGAELPRSSIGGMTIYTGGFEAEFGNAMSAVVNVVTKGGDNTHSLAVRFEKDNWIPSRWDKQTDQYNEVELTARGPVIRDNLFYLQSFIGRFQNTRWWQDMNVFFPSPNNSEYSGFTKFDYIASPTLRVSLQGIYSFHQFYDYEFSWRYNLDGLPKRSKNSIRVTATVTNTISDNSSLSLSISRFYLQNRVGVGKKADVNLEPYRYDLFLRYVIDGERNWWANTQQLIHTVKGDYTSQIDKTQFFKAGFEGNFYEVFNDLVKFEPQRTYFGKTLENAPLLNYSNTYDYFPRTGSAFIQDKIQFSRDGSMLSVGVRWDFLDPRARRPIVEFIPTSPTEFQQQVNGSAKSTFKQQFSPRIAFAAPMGPSSMFFVNFGHYFQFPLFSYLYSGTNPEQIRNGAKNILSGNPDLLPERTIAWEIGYKHALDEYFVGSMTFFQKNMKNQIDSKTLIPFDSKAAGDYGFAQYVNNAEAQATGLEFVISRERDERISGSLSYTYMVTEGTSELANQAINLAQWGFPIKSTSFPLSWDQRHTVKLDAEMKLPFGVQSNLVVWYNSPKPYTYFPTRDGFTTIDTTKDFVPNNARMSSVAFANLKFSRRFEFGEEHIVAVTAYMDIRNLTNAKNVRWMDSNGRIGGELSDPSAYYDLRRVRAGASVEF
jgi:outer membrane receptor for ferrienterochelin and colicin